MSAETARIEFETRSADRDYSGLTIENRFLADQDLERSFFNGVNLLICVFTGVRMSNTEFSEARIQDTEFVNVDLSGSDFVDSLIENTDFVGCNFAKGEWRDTTFRHCKFSELAFDHTTVMLCTFVDCEFDPKTLQTFAHRAAYFNIASHCKFPSPVSDTHFASRNFGFPAFPNQQAIVRGDSLISIEQLCLLNNVGRLRAIDVAGVAETICNSLAERTQRRTSTLIFYSKVVRTLTEERRISPTTLIYLEQTITRFAGSAEDQDTFTAAMAAVIEIRSALFSVANEATNPDYESPSTPTREVVIRFAESYTENQVEVLRDTLASISDAGEPGFIIATIRQGSTIIELIPAAMVSLGTFLVTLNFVLRQAQITIKRTIDLKRTVEKSRKKETKPKKARKKLPAVLKSGPVLPELAPVRAAVSRHGRLLIEFDEKATVTVLVSSSAQADVVMVKEG